MVDVLQCLARLTGLELKSALGRKTMDATVTQRI
jgi:hypothetical protein